MKVSDSDEDRVEMRPYFFIHLSFSFFKEEEDCEESIAESFEEAFKKKTVKEMRKKDKM